MSSWWQRHRTSNFPACYVERDDLLTGEFVPVLQLEIWKACSHRLTKEYINVDYSSLGSMILGILWIKWTLPAR